MNSNACLESEGSSTTSYDSTAIEHNQLEDEPLSWDQPREIPSHVFNEEEDASDLYSVMKIIKLIAYVLGFAIVLVGASLSQLSFTLIGAQMNLTGEKSVRILWNFGALIMLITPKLFLFVKCLGKRGAEKPATVRGTLVVIILESISAFGDGLWVFLVLPNTPSQLVPLFFLSLGWVPAVLRSPTSMTARSPRLRTIQRFLTLLAGFILAHFPLYAYMLIENVQHVSPSYFICLTLSVLCCSVRWCTNRFPNDSEQNHEALLVKVLNEMNIVKGSSRFLRFKFWLNSIWKRTKQYSSCAMMEAANCRYRTYTYVAIAEVIIYGLLCNIFLPGSLAFNQLKYSEAFSQLQPMLFQFRWVAIGMISTYLTYSTAQTMCKISMQFVSFSLPLTLAPCIVFLLVFVCEQSTKTGISPSTAYLLTDELITLDISQYWRKSALWIVTVGLLLCHGLVASHIFNINQNKFSSRDSLFSSPFYEGTCIVQSLLFSRKETDDDQQMIASNTKEKPSPTIYMCATMWHETIEEMQQLFISIFRTDLEQMAIEKTNRKKGMRTNDQYNFEVHILFDDAFETRINQTTNQPARFVNKYVKGLETAIYNAANIVLKTNKSTLCHPTRFVTPYGGQLIWKTPGGKPIIVHLKDKTKIRNKKRWSQVMYLYYLLTFKKPLIMKKSKKSNASNAYKPFRELLQRDCLKNANNTFILMLDGDIDWKPSAIRLLLNDLLKNEQTGAVCARIMPSGAGPIVWYQMIEYAVQHWLAKTMENTFGCVLCTPGCFSLYRASALLDDNVMKAYSKTAEEANELVQYDQGEDRWLCTLLLQCRSGYRVNYCAAACAVASSPTTFSEFLNQRRRWIPSSLINHFSFIESGLKIIKYNKNIPFLYIVMQTISFLSNVTAPAFIIIYMPSALTFSGLELSTAYALIIVPAVIHLIVCMTCVKSTQIRLTAILSLCMALFFMMAFATSIFAVIYETDNYANYFIVFVTGISIFAGCIHPFEISNLLFLPLYIVGTPIMFLLFFNFALCNINDMGWGTREAAATGDSATKKNIVTRSIAALFRRWEALIEPENSTPSHQLNTVVIEQNGNRPALAPSNTMVTNVNISTSNIKNTLQTSDFTQVWCDNDKEIEYQSSQGNYKLNPDEDRFWQDLISKYLKPIDLTSKEKDAMLKKLTSFRNKVVIGYSAITALLIIAQYQIALVSMRLDFQIKIFIGSNYLRVDYLTLCLLVFYLIQIILQVVGMLHHRVGTLMEYLFITKLFQSKQNAIDGIHTVQEQHQINDEIERLRVEIRQDQTISSNASTLQYSSLDDVSSISDRDQTISDVDAHLSYL